MEKWRESFHQATRRIHPTHKCTRVERTNASVEMEKKIIFKMETTFLERKQCGCWAEGIMIEGGKACRLKLSGTSHQSDYAGLVVESPEIRRNGKERNGWMTG